jgi:Na+/H+ antiporter NhaD/arsenite permease-like protein
MSASHSDHTPSSRPPLTAIAVVILLFVALCWMGWPQRATEMIRSAAHHGEHDESHSTTEDPPEQGGGDHVIQAPSPLMVAPFVVLLLCVAVLPLIDRTKHWWESNLHRFYIACFLALVTLAYYVFLHSTGVESHWPAHGFVDVDTSAPLQWGLAMTVFANAILHEYIPFIVLLFSLYTISGGIRIEGNLAAHSLTNTTIIATGGLLASFVGTTGAAMLLIRPLLETNRERKYKVHTVIFFIFVVCNCGGCLLPIGDPPLFLGYLRGVDFFWTLRLWPQWLFVNLNLLMVYLVWDHFFCYPRETKPDIRADETRVRAITVSGWMVNAPLLLGVVVCVALLDPSKPVPGTSWHAPLYLREIIQLALVGVSLLLGSHAIRKANRFTYHAIIEVAALFFGIFICMQPALQILNERGGQLGLETPMPFFWSTGSLSAVLDNAPTYVVFFETARALNETGIPVPTTVIQDDLLVAISLGAVFMGAMTYIGNGPNFMVKAIAETSGVRMPSFFGFMVYSFAVLLPILVLTSLVFL